MGGREERERSVRHLPVWATEPRQCVGILLFDIFIFPLVYTGPRYRDCHALWEAGRRGSAVYDIYPYGPQSPVSVRAYCPLYDISSFPLVYTGPRYRDCHALWEAGRNGSAVYDIYPYGPQSFHSVWAYCYMTYLLFL